MIYVLLPAYNEENSLDYLLPKFKNLFENTLKVEYQMIACNDGSRDTTLQKLEEWKDKVPMTIVNHKLNRGLGETIRDLFEYVAEIAHDDDIVIRMDCDDTHEPEFVIGMIDKLNEGYDMVIASRFVKGGAQEGLSFYRRWISARANGFMKFFFPVKGLKEYSSGYRAYTGRSIKHAINVFQNNFIQLKGLGFSCTLEKIVKFKILGAKIGEAPMVLRYDQKKSESKMIASITTLGYIMLVILYYWPFSGWKRQYKNVPKLHPSGK